MSQHPEGKIGRLKLRKDSRQPSVGLGNRHPRHGESFAEQKHRLQIQMPFPGNPDAVLDRAANRLRTVIRQRRFRHSAATTLRHRHQNHALQRTMRTGRQPGQYHQQCTDGPNLRHVQTLCQTRHTVKQHTNPTPHRPGPSFVPYRSAPSPTIPPKRPPGFHTPRHPNHAAAPPNGCVCPAQTSGPIPDSSAHPLTTPTTRADQPDQKETIPMTISRAPNGLPNLRPNHLQAPTHTESPTRRTLPNPVPSYGFAFFEFVSWIH
ncbi:MAG: hypothetical protein KatS3mg132_565 [Limisphaera sp.]|nr:MAG: hypothetical protein KatS3mg132_565 [Limisphaera sp.]